nr:MAG TPA: hypothetical protein [Caudoviricetes sp.]
MYMYKQPDYLMHHGVKGMKWGVRKKIATYRLNRNAKKANKYQEASDRQKAKANRMHESAAEQGPIAYGKSYNRIKQANNNAKQLQKYSNHYTKITNSYIKKLGDKYKLVYDVSTKQYSLREK